MRIPRPVPSPLLALLCLALFCLACLPLPSTGAAEPGQRAAELPLVVFLIGEDEYKTEQTLPEFAKQELGATARCEFVHAEKQDMNRFPGLEVLERADLLFVSVRRRTPPEAQMAAIRAYVEAGKPVVGIRTASHAFSLRGKPAPAGHASWLEFDAEVIGGNYTGHTGTPKPEGPRLWVTPVGEHPLTAELPAKRFQSFGSLYKVSPLADSATALLLGTIDGNANPEPVAWINTNRHGGRVFYTSLGHEDDFAVPAFREMLRRGVAWALEKPAE